MNLAEGLEQLIDAALRGAKPDPELEVDRWSEEFMVLPSETALPGKYRLSRTPMARRILRALSPGDPCLRVVIMGASQMLKTQIALNFLMARAHRAPGNMLVLEPTDSLVKRLSARVAKIIRLVPELRAIFAAPRSRDAKNNTYTKDFEGGTMTLATAGSASNLAEIPAPIVFIDEVDRVVQNVGKEGDTVGLAEARATTFVETGQAKFLEVSSPLLAGSSKIFELFEQGTQEVYLVPCPHCSHHHELQLSNFRYARDPDSGHMARAWFVCPECGAEIEERDKARMLRDPELGGTAHWFAKSLGDGETVSVHVSAFYAMSGSIGWVRLARQHAHAAEELQRGNQHPMQVFYNTRLALPWNPDQSEQTTTQHLQARQLADALPARVIPDRALVVTIAVDTQDDRLEVQAEAWGPGLEHWTIDYAVLMGNPAAAIDTPGSCWAQLDAYRRQPFEHEAAPGVLIPSSVFGIDSGGSHTQDVYSYGAQRAHVGCVILKGANKPNRPIISSVPTKVDIDHGGNRIEGGALLWMVGSDVAKDHLHNRLAVADGPGAHHFTKHLPDSWFEGLLAERPKLTRIKTGPRAGRMVRAWLEVTPGAPNEPLDLTAYNLALAHFLGLHRWASNDWATLRERLLSRPATPTPVAPQVQHQAASGPARQAIAPAAAAAGRRILNRGLR